MSFTFDLKPASDTKLIVNCISVPNSTNADTLAAYINGAAQTKLSKNIVTAIYKFNAATAGSEGPESAIFDTASGSRIGGTNFTITQGEGLQVYTTDPLNITIQ